MLANASSITACGMVPAEIRTGPTAFDTHNLLSNRYELSRKKTRNVLGNWPKLFQAFFVKFTLIFFISVFIKSFHISTCKHVSDNRSVSRLTD